MPFCSGWIRRVSIGGWTVNTSQSRHTNRECQIPEMMLKQALQWLVRASCGSLSDHYYYPDIRSGPVSLETRSSGAVGSLGSHSR